MRPTVGIICEYDPFHRGHARQFALVREKLPDARLVCVMSGCFTQRGSPALFSTAVRARAALTAGASLVLELPCAFALREAENFALGGVAILHGLGFVTHLSFGSEDADLPFLQATATLLEQPDAAFTAALRALLAQGQPFAAAQAGAAATRLPAGALAGGEPVARALAKPNNILGVCYLRALLRLQSSLQPLPVQRIGDYHARSLNGQGFPSASATRKAYLEGDMRAAEAACGYPLAGDACHRPEALDTVLLHTLRNASPEWLKSLPDCTEGLENRLQTTAQVATSRADLLDRMKTRRYARARLNRLAGHAMLGITAALLRAYPLPRYARLLGFRRDDRACLSLLKESRLPVLAKAADGDFSDPMYALDARAYDLWALGAGLPAGLMCRQPLAIL